MKKSKKLKRIFGINENGLIDFPKKISGTSISRIKYGNELGCSRCFPHGFEVKNATYYKFQRSWKKYRKTRWKN
ncbi:phosphate ABC transporter substrate-binding protein [Chryseobacterium sp. JK1]|uniref:phosphate ABC transporter substrate-binding protein n=1 Tax=Chryseobacterium sp. JK1 TaxID=874294 RepID=UPI003D6812F7